MGPRFIDCMTLGSKPDASPPDYHFLPGFSEYSGFVGYF